MYNFHKKGLLQSNLHYNHTKVSISVLQRLILQFLTMFLKFVAILDNQVIVDLLPVHMVPWELFLFNCRELNCDLLDLLAD